MCGLDLLPQCFFEEDEDIVKRVDCCISCFKLSILSSKDEIGRL